MDTRALFWRSRPTEVCASGRFQVKIKHLHYEKNNFSHCLISLPAAAQIIPPRYAGSDDPDVFRKQFEKKVTKVMKRDGYRIEELSHELLMKFTIDTLGRCVDVQYPDSLGGVRFNPTQRSRELLNTALSELNPFTPAYKDGRKIPYVRKMLINMNFLPGAFVKPTFRGKKDGLMAFREYLNRNLVHDTKLYEAGVYGTVRVEFYIEPDGTITLVGASESPHPALTEHVQKLILDTSGQWTPLLEMGHPCRYLISFPVNFDPGESTSYATGIPL